MLKYFNTIKYLYISQIIQYLIKIPRRYFSVFILNKKKNIPILKKIKKKNFYVLKYNNDFDNQIKKKIDKKINPWRAQSNKLFIYNVNYLNFIFLYPKKKSIKFIYSWIDKNELSSKSIAWEPYPTSLRLVNLIKWSLKNNYTSRKILDSILLHSNYLLMNLEYHLRGNHLFSNYKALIFSFIFLKKSCENKKIKKIYSEFYKELECQILNDGGHFEQSPMYHNQFVYDLLDLVQIKKLYKLENKKIKNKLSKMLYWSKANSHNNEVSLFNDSCIDIQPNYLDLIKYFHKLKLKLSNKFKVKKSLYFFRDSGYIIYNNNKYKIIFRSGGIKANYIPAHQHANTTSIEISNRYEKIFSNSGISTYENNALRLKQRGTMFQNTISVNKKNTMEVWKSFRVATRPNVKSAITFKNKKVVKFFCEHDGFTDSLFNKIVHKRIISCYKNYIEINDNVDGVGKIKLFINFFLENKINVTKKKNIIFLNKKAFNSQILFQKKATIRVKNSFINYNYFKKSKNKNIQIQKNINLPYKVKTKIIFK